MDVKADGLWYGQFHISREKRKLVECYYGIDAFLTITCGAVTLNLSMVFVRLTVCKPG